MAENVGGIVWTAEMRTEQLVQAEKQATSSLNRTEQAYDRTAKGAERSNIRMKKSAESVSKATNGMSRNFGMAGIQVQQFVGQIQGGQSALLALSQQGADLGFVLGAAGLGAAVGIAATAFSFLLPLLQSNTEEVEDLTGALRELASQQQLTAEQAAILSEAEGRKVAENYEKQKKLIKQLADAEALAKRQRGAIATAGTDQEEIARYSKGLQDTQATISKLKVAIVVTNKEIEKGTKNIITYNNNIGDASETTEQITDRQDKLTQSLTKQLTVLRDGEIAGLRYAAAQALQLKAGEQLPPEIEKIIQAIEKETAAKIASAEQDKKNMQAARDMAAFKAKQARESEQREATIQGLEQELMLAEAKRDLASEEYELKLAIMSLGANADTSEIERITELVGKMQQLRFESQLAGKSIGESFRDIGVGAMDDFAGATANAIMNQESLGDAVKGVARSIITDMLKAIIRYWIGQAAAALAGNAAVTSATVAAAGVSGAAWAVPATLASVATLGGAAATGATALAGAVTAGQGLAMAGGVGPGRLNGGPVNPGTIYPVTEDGKPELLMQGGKQYLLPGSRGEVISNKDMSSNNSGNITVSMPTTFYGDVDKQQARNMLFDNEDLIWSIVEQAKAKRGIA